MHQVKQKVNEAIRRYKEIERECTMNFGGADAEYSYLKPLESFVEPYDPRIPDFDVTQYKTGPFAVDDDEMADESTGTPEATPPITPANVNSKLKRPSKTSKPKEDALTKDAAAKKRKSPSTSKTVAKKSPAEKTGTREDNKSLKFASFINNFRNCLKTPSQMTNEQRSSLGKHDGYVNVAWYVFCECYKSSFNYSLVPFDAFTDLFYVKLDRLAGKDVVVICVSEQTFNARTQTNLCVVRRRLWDKNVVLFNVPIEDRTYDYFLNKIVVPYIYYANVQREHFINVFVAEENKNEPDVPCYSTHSFDNLFEKIKSLL